jgi:hypothetical protein
VVAYVSKNDGLAVIPLPDETGEVLMSKLNDKMKEAFQAYITENFPKETLREVLFVSEEPNEWLRRLLLGAAISVAATRYYYTGLTEKRILLMLPNSPTSDVKQIMLGRVSNMIFNEGVLSGKLIIEYGENVKRVLTIDRNQFENANNFVKAYSLLPKPSLSTQDEEKAQQSEAKHQMDYEYRIAIAIAVTVILIIIVVLLNPA